MALIVQKFGGSSVKDRDRIFNVARIVANTHNAGNDVVVVVSAQGDTTDDLIAKAAEISHDPSAREMDMLLATGEQISISLLSMALNEIGCHAISLTGWQAGFRTDRAYTKARITRLETERISSELERNRVVVVAGFQGLNKLDDITTLGRGGSDTSAVAIAAALHADRCQIFTDVEGVYTADPRKVRNTRKLQEITFDEMLELASLGAQVLNNRSVELAKKYNVELEVLSSLNPVPGTVVKEVAKMEGMLIKGVAKDTDVAVITILNVPDEPGTSFKIFGLLAQKNINVDIILQSTGRDGKKDISFTCAQGEAETRILRYCIMQSPKREEFLKITRTGAYSFSDVEGVRTFTVGNKNAFLHMMEGALTGKTGFTGNAGYCYVGALRQEERTFIVALLACGWPNNRSYKWSDTRKLMSYGLENYTYRKVWQEPDFPEIPVKNAVPENGDLTEDVYTAVRLSKCDPGAALLLSDADTLQVKTVLPSELSAPLAPGTVVGSVRYYLNGQVVKVYPVQTAEEVEAADICWCLRKVTERYLFWKGMEPQEKEG